MEEFRRREDGCKISSRIAKTYADLERCGKNGWRFREETISGGESAAGAKAVGPNMSEVRAAKKAEGVEMGRPGGSSQEK